MGNARTLDAASNCCGFSWADFPETRGYSAVKSEGIENNDFNDFLE
jgi:hypothetical protein